MTTWFDRYRGINQGRIPSSSAPDGDYIFVLGEKNPEELSRLTVGDYTEVRQLCDLTNYDFLKVTMDTIGQPYGSVILPATWTDSSSELFKFYFNDPSAQSVNEVIPAGYSQGFPLTSIGYVRNAVETYSGSDTYCRLIPAGNILPAHLIGVHNPTVSTPLTTLNTYTLQLWVNFNVDSHPTSWGVDFNLFRFFGQVGGNSYGIDLTMYGYTGPGAHTWYPFLTHYNGASSSGIALDPYDISTNQGWQMLTIVYDSSLAPVDRIHVYLNNKSKGSPFSSISVSPAVPPNDGELQYGDQKCWGELDSLRMLDSAFDTVAVEESYDEMTTPGDQIDVGMEQFILIDGEVYAERLIHAGESRRWTDFIAPIRHLSGQHEITFRMGLGDATIETPEIIFLTEGDGGPILTEGDGGAQLTERP